MDEKMKFISELGHYSYWKDDPLIFEIWNERLKNYSFSEIKEAVRYLIHNRHLFMTLSGIIEIIEEERRRRK